MFKLKMKISFVFLIFSMAANAFGQLPNLTVSSGSFEPATISAGQMLTIHSIVHNSGSGYAGSCHLAFYISTTTTITDGYLLGSVSVPPLGAGASSNDIELVIPVPQYVLQGSYYVGWEVDSYNEVSESDENNGFYLPATQLSVTAGLIYGQHIPYPMIFIHGLNSNDTTWNSFATFLERFGWTNGGRMDFCLNMDGNLSTSLLSTDYYDFTNETNLKPADFYFVNFDVNPNGSTHNNTVESNESAVVKQGIAIHDAIRHALNISKRENVILVGHSMGGLAAREYLQNYSNWQGDGQHHVAKLVTIGTPHGGSDQWTFGLLDGYSEAVRDLRTSYSNNAVGVYLFGGNENNISTIGFHNIDVNCNGLIGDSIIGLNQKNISTNLSYSCIIGNASGTGDGIVSADKANLNNYYTLNADTFFVNAWHSEALANFYGGNFETGSFSTEMRGLDEPTYFNQSYKIDLDSLYFGTITPQSKGSLLYPDTTDYDDYKFNLHSNGMVQLNVKDIPVFHLKMELFDSTYTSLIAKISNGLSEMDTTIALNSGQYFLEISGIPDVKSWEFAYAFSVGFTPTTSVTTDKNDIPKEYSLLQNYPNPFNPSTTISFTLPVESFVNLKIFDVLGREVSSLVNEKKIAGHYSVTVNGSNWPSGVYFYRLQAGTFSETKKLILLK